MAVPALLGKVGLFCTDIVDYVEFVLTGEGEVTSDYLVEGDPDCPYVNSFVVASSFENLWGLIFKSSCRC